MTVLDNVVRVATIYSSLTVKPKSRIGGDLRIHRDDYIDFCGTLEKTYDVDLRPFFAEGDLTVAALAGYISRETGVA